MEPKWCPEDPLETPWTHFGRFGGDLGAPRALRGCSRDLPGTLHGRSGTLRGHPGDPWERFFEFCSDFGGVLGGGVEMSTFLDGFGVDLSALFGCFFVRFFSDFARS